MNYLKKVNSLYLLLSLLIVGLSYTSSQAQVILRDTTVTWQHHSYALNPDYSMDTWTTDNTDIEEVSFSGAKVIENDLIRLVVVPEYGARVLSHYYKPTQHEYLYQSECGSPYGMNAGNFYYDWLMVWGGIFPTFPEPEHGKAWLVPWDYSVVKNTTDTVTIQMQYTDERSFDGAPGGFNNGTTNITCVVEVSVYSHSASWDFDVKLINNEAESVNYEYWTCTTLTPGSEVGKTASPLNSEMIIPSEEYFAAWSPGAWIGNYNTHYAMSDIAYLDDWVDMGIAYAADFKANYWGVINHENEEGIMRISDNQETPGVKLWTWGRNNVDNNMFDFNNGGADNYIELWAGASESFFTDETLSANEQKSWKESYCATVGMTGIDAMDYHAALHLLWNEASQSLGYELNTFQSDAVYTLVLSLDNPSGFTVEKEIAFDALGQTADYDLTAEDISAGYYMASLELRNTEDEVILSSAREIYVGTVLHADIAGPDLNQMAIHALGNQRIMAQMTEPGHYAYQVYNLNGQTVQQAQVDDSQIDIQLSEAGIYLLRVADGHSVVTRKIAVR
ncbi:Por secretion system C-terminal sorting domain-containing protein [Reichenbachiella agariperforans]|uniref:Por secretion system C-terminal sorting domain-containing protein n=1 Tax=Reichenbachiella agariperforans TaxID=156994 RepID=A0A1M6Q0P9_REIAG|nr:DUF5107 domain-containing protein [Reichenbachiella agariperforans]SHK13686.1 Por secretion system C-terminal sorting domain-containing protein [Reichenbachiella agariperforans]